MGQVTIYLDEQTEQTARAAAESDAISLSKWIAQRIQRSAGTEWPTALKELAGAWADMEPADQIRRSPAKDVKRDRL